jgi:hypothetical protein
MRLADWYKYLFPLILFFQAVSLRMQYSLPSTVYRVNCCHKTEISGRDSLLDCNNIEYRTYEESLLRQRECDPREGLMLAGVLNSHSPQGGVGIIGGRVWPGFRSPMGPTFKTTHLGNSPFWEQQCYPLQYSEIMILTRDNCKQGHSHQSAETVPPRCTTSSSRLTSGCIKMRSFAAVLCVVFLSIVNSQDYAEYARGAGMARKKSSR